MELKKSVPSIDICHSPPQESQQNTTTRATLLYLLSSSCAQSCIGYSDLYVYIHARAALLTKAPDGKIYSAASLSSRRKNYLYCAQLHYYPMLRANSILSLALGRCTCVHATKISRENFLFAII